MPETKQLFSLGVDTKDASRTNSKNDGLQFRALQQLLVWLLESYSIHPL